MRPTDRIIIALDVSSRDDALSLVQSLQDLTAMFKVGGQLFMAVGPRIVWEILDRGSRVFLDLKFHDIPNTVSRSALEAARQGVSMLTVHALGGRAMLEAVMRDLQEEFGSNRPLVIAVTVLTSLDGPALAELGMQTPIQDQVQRLALLAQSAGADGVVCAPQEIALLRPLLEPRMKVVTPGIRLAHQATHDQHRIATPQHALAAGADYIVLGRSVTQSPDPRRTLENILDLG